jgi:hypothetical protein
LSLSTLIFTILENSFRYFYLLGPSKLNNVHQLAETN